MTTKFPTDLLKKLFQTPAERKNLRCPECKDGFQIIFPRYINGKLIASLPCTICNGTGFLPDNVEYRPEEGAALKTERMAEQWG